MATKQGHSIIFGTGTLATTLAGMSNLNLLQGWDKTRSSDKEETRNQDGDVASVVYYNERQAASLDFVVSGGTAAATPTTLTAALSPGALVTLGGSLVQDINKVWIVSDQGAQVTSSNTGAVRARISLERYEANSLPA